jgi:hypothetical protein
MFDTVIHTFEVDYFVYDVDSIQLLIAVVVRLTYILW